MPNPSAIPWQPLSPNDRHTWLVPEHEAEFSSFLAIGSKEAKSGAALQAQTLFHEYSGGVKTNRDMIVYDFDRTTLSQRIHQFIEDYNAEVIRYQAAGRPSNVDDFVSYEHVKWSESLKSHLERGELAQFQPTSLRSSLYRPFSKRQLYFDRILNERVYVFTSIFPTPESESQNKTIWVKVGRDWPMFALMAAQIVDLLPQGGSQCFPFYVYDEDGTNRRDNITDWALTQFREHYADPAIDKWDIFYYVYGLLHHPAYRERYADSLKRDLPRIPFAPDFAAFSSAGRELADWHLNYEEAERYELQWIHDGPIDWRVEKMRLRGRNKKTGAEHDHLVYNDTLTLAGIPPQVFAYRLGNRCALEWIVDQYRVKTDNRSGITHDPNTYSDDPQYIVKLVERVVKVSLETVRIVNALAPLPFR